MGTKVLLLLTVILVLGQQSLAKPCKCESDSSSEEDALKRRCNTFFRRACGYSGITRQQCLTRNCCFDSSIQMCYHYSVRDVDQCSISPENRKDCGSPGISATDCYAKGCCYDSSKQGAIFCFHGSK